ncbi:SIMPL domain-containing protein [Paenibacillus senegalimassiliensis]|uniref:SIMPL domain-containing protein n=1 Tax=Paenibacillus senegalimassiliensis TaxID=1737426 RepID=UPI00073E2BA9|nr:SIMPL domain-containing protein [Paenibacillus senegalimassiliensis]
MKTWMKPAAALAIAGAMVVGGTFLAGGLNSPKTVNAAEASARNIVTVEGSGKLSVKPDIAYLSIGAATEAKTAKEAQAANATKIAALTKLLKDTWGIADKDIQTGQFYVQPNYSYNDQEGQQIKGYSAQHTLKVTYRDLEKVGQLLDAAAAAGANRIDNISFSTENPDQYQEQVIQKAVDDAGKKAQAIAKATGRQIGIVLSVSQGSMATPMYRESYEMLNSAAKVADQSTAIEPGEIDLQTTLTVIYELK